MLVLATLKMVKLIAEICLWLLYNNCTFVDLFFKKNASSSFRFETFERGTEVTEVYALGATNLKQVSGPLGHIPPIVNRLQSYIHFTFMSIAVVNAFHEELLEIQTFCYYIYMLRYHFFFFFSFLYRAIVLDIQIIKPTICTNVLF
jgi:hypothetical protein